MEGTPVTPETTLSPDAVGSGSIDQTFQVSSDLDLPWLPVAYPPQRVEVPGISVNFDAETGTAILDGNLDAGTVYRVSSVSVQPTPDQLASVVFPFVPSTRYTALPEDLPPGIREIALRVDRRRRQRLRAGPGDPGPPVRYLGVHVLPGRPCA